jgi:carbon-monoxide dehydrogenase small subunit
VPGNLIKLRFQLNGAGVVLQCPPGARLLDILRREFELYETREGCGQGECGACQVLLDGQAVNSCLVPAFMLSDADVVTIEGIRTLKAFAGFQKRLLDREVFRCGHCASGMQVALVALWMRNPEPSEEELQRALSGNLCACGGYRAIIEAAGSGTNRRRRHARRRD